MTKPASNAVMVSDIEVVEDLSSKSRCDEGYLRLRRLKVRNRRADGSASRDYRVDIVDRPALDAVAVLIHRQKAGRREALTRKVLRPAAYFRREKKPILPEPSHLLVEELVAGVLEPEDVGEAGLLHRAAEEVWEEAGFRVKPEAVKLLGGPFFVAPGIVSEQIFVTTVDVTGLPQSEPLGDGSPLEEGAVLAWSPIEELLAHCRRGELRDAKTEIALARFLAQPRPA